MSAAKTRNCDWSRGKPNQKSIPHLFREQWHAMQKKAKQKLKNTRFKGFAFIVVRCFHLHQIIRNVGRFNFTRSNLICWHQAT